MPLTEEQREELEKLKALEAEEANDNKDKDDDEDDEEEDDDVKKISQKDLSALMTKEKKSGFRAAYKKLGFKNEKEAVAAIAAYKKLQKDNLSDDDKESEELKEANRKAADAEEKVMIAEAKVVALSLDVNPKYLEDVIVLALSKADDVEEVEEVIEGMKVSYPAFFRKASKDEDDDEDKEDKKKKGKGTGKPPANKKKKNTEEKSLGSRLAKARAVSKKSHFSN